jgi:TonB family protein
MKKIISLFAVVLTSILVFGQKEEPVYTYVQTMPSYPGGEEALYKNLRENITYPEREKSMNIEGTVYVMFVIEKDGTPTHFKVQRGVLDGAGLDSTALFACKQLGKFNPGTQNDVPQRVNLTIPIKFTLEGSEEEVKLSKMELWKIEIDGRYICTALSEMAAAQVSGDTEKMNKLTADFEIKAAALEKRYAKGSLHEKELDRIVQPCFEETRKLMLEK